MAKQHSVTKLGIVVGGLVFATVLPHTEELAENTRSAGRFASGLACIAQDLTGGMVTMPICVEGDAPAEAPTSGSTQGG